MNAVSARGLVKRYRSVDALRGVDIDIRTGEVFGLLGPNGAGKTTFLKCVLGLLRPSDGTVEIFGRPPTNPASRRDVGFAPEIPRFSDFLSATEIMRTHARLIGMERGAAETQIEALLEQADIADAPKRVKQFSKGMVRRLAVALSLLGDPKLLLLDEPTADLDPIGRRQIRNELVRRKEAGTTILLNSHLLSEVERVCDRVAIIHKGRVLASGEIHELVPEGKDLEDVFIELVEKAGS